LVDDEDFTGIYFTGNKLVPPLAIATVERRLKSSCLLPYPHNKYLHQPT